jgi:hypothetical protein
MMQFQNLSFTAGFVFYSVNVAINKLDFSSEAAVTRSGFYYLPGGYTCFKKPDNE